MKQRSTTAVLLAYQYIIQSIASKQFCEKDSLPPLKEMAARARVSVPSMAKATALLKDKDIIEGVNGRRCTVKTGAVAFCKTLVQKQEQDIHLPVIAESAWRRVYEQIKREILNGTFPASAPLPTMKELQNRYSTSFRTLKKALYALFSENMLVPWKKHYAVRQPTAEKLNRRIVFLALADVEENLALGNFTEEYLRYLEIECSNAGIGIDVIGHKAGDDDFCFIKPGMGRISLEDNDSTAGYIFVIVAETLGMEKVFRFLAHVNKPVAVLDVVGNRQLPPYLCRENVRLFSAAVSSRPGRLVARYLLSRGHRHIA
ncbi:MAG: GntR family transcriptional regulator, partial [Chitinivibrionales bacterium]|nr:GntR family transcriptional regulator [Chitinivibrionales bacterium]